MGKTPATEVPSQPVASAVDATRIDATALLSLLSDRTRLGVVMSLRGGPKNVTELQGIVGGNQPTLSHHLMLLRVNGLVVNARVGRTVAYSLASSVIVDAGGVTVSFQTSTVKVTIE